MVSALKRIGYNEIGLEQIRRALEKPEEKRYFGIARAENLILVDIKYDFEFEYEERLKRKVRKIEDRVIRNSLNISPS
jgi:tRNA U38,U39,U40 pseudouridine synthase TruA